MNAINYRDEVLQPIVVPVFQAHPHLHVFQQDNVRPHTVRVSMQFLAASAISVLPWPAGSPDMAPIEHVCDELGWRHRRKQHIQTMRRPL